MITPELLPSEVTSAAAMVGEAWDEENEELLELLLQSQVVCPAVMVCCWATVLPCVAVSRGKYSNFKGQDHIVDTRILCSTEVSIHITLLHPSHNAGYHNYSS